MSKIVELLKPLTLDVCLATYPYNFWYEERAGNRVIATDWKIRGEFKTHNGRVVE